MTLTSILMTITAAAAVGALLYLVGRAGAAPPLPETEEEKQKLIAAARAEAEAMVRQASVEAREIAHRASSDLDAELRQRRQELERRAADTAARAQQLE